MFGKVTVVRHGVTQGFVGMVTDGAGRDGGLAPVTRRSGISIRGEHPPRGGNKVLKRALFLSAFAALSDPVSRTYYDRKRAQQKKHNEALIALARRRTDVLYAMLRDNKPYPNRHKLLLDKRHRGTPLSAVKRPCV